MRVQSNVIELYWHVINSAFQIDIDSKNHTVGICHLWQFEWWGIGFVPESLCLYFRCCSNCFLTKCATRLKGPGQVGCIQGSPVTSVPCPHACFCLSVLGHLLSWYEMVLVARSTVPTLAAPVPSAFKGCNKKQRVWLMWIHFSNSLQRCQLREPVEGRASRWLLSFCQLSHCVICKLPLAPLLMDLCAVFQVSWSAGWWPSFISRVQGRIRCVEDKLALSDLFLAWERWVIARESKAERCPLRQGQEKALRMQLWPYGRVW